MQTTPKVDLTYKVSLISEQQQQQQEPQEQQQEQPSVPKEDKKKKPKTKKPRRNELSGLGIKKEDGEFIVSFI